MKKFFSLIVLFLLCIPSFAQKIQFSDNTNAWSMVDSTMACCVLIPVRYATAYYDSNTVSYNGFTYQTLYTSLTTVLTREDAGKVYVIGTTDSIERVLYDFTLNVNDTTRLTYPEDKYIAWVTQIDSTQLAGIWYKVWHFEGTDSALYFPDSVRSITYNVIEGIGCTNGVYYPAEPYYLALSVQHLLCFSSDLGINSALSKPVASYSNGCIGSYYDNDSSCILFYEPHGIVLHGEGVQQLCQKNNNALVIPNPVNETSKIVFPYNILSGRLVLVNDIGQIVATIPFKNETGLQIGDKINLPGVYSYRLMDNENGKIFTGKFIAQ